jgi:hypothetical protein
MDVLKARVKGLSEGLEPELSVVVDVMVPLEQLTSHRGLSGQIPGDAGYPGMSKHWAPFYSP